MTCRLPTGRQAGCVSINKRATLRARPLRHDLPGAIRAGWPTRIAGAILAAWLALPGLAAAQGNVQNADLHVNGFGFFGTNAAAATVVTSGWGSVYVDGSAEIASNLVVRGQVPDLAARLFKTPPGGPQVIGPAGQINPTYTYLLLEGGAQDVVLGTPQIVAGADGQQLVVRGTRDDRRIVVQDGRGVQTALDQPCYLGLYDTLSLVYDLATTNWIELHRSDN